MGGYSFGLGVDTSAYPAQLIISGATPVNTQPTSKPPLVPFQSSTASTGGSILPGTYQIAFSTNGVIGPVSGFTTAVVPAGTNTNTITVAGIQWQSGAAPSILPFIGTSSMNMHAAAGGSYTSGTPDANGNPTSYTFTDFIQDGSGLPDVKFSKFLVEEIEIAHSGVWTGTITAIDGTGMVLTFGPSGALVAAWGTDVWASRVLSLYYRPGVTTQPGLNLTVSANTVNTVTVSATGFQVGDVVVLRFKAGNISSNTIGDAGVTSYSYGSPGHVSRIIQGHRGSAGTGLTVNAEAGNLIFIISGAGARQALKTVAGNSTSVFTITGTWDVMPDATSVFIVLAPTVAYSYTTKPLINDGSQAAVGVVAITPAVQSQSQQLFISVSTADVNGNAWPIQYQPFREIYVPHQSPIANVSVGDFNDLVGA